MIPTLQWHILYDAFAAFAAMARQYHFYEEAKMEASLFEMSPYKKNRKG